MQAYLISGESMMNNKAKLARIYGGVKTKG